jgi:hypothetical protein
MRYLQERDRPQWPSLVEDVESSSQGLKREHRLGIPELGVPRTFEPNTPYSETFQVTSFPARLRLVTTRGTVEIPLQLKPPPQLLDKLYPIIWLSGLRIYNDNDQLDIAKVELAFNNTYLDDTSRRIWQTAQSRQTLIPAIQAEAGNLDRFTIRAHITYRVKREKDMGNIDAVRKAVNNNDAAALRAIFEVLSPGAGDLTYRLHNGLSNKEIVELFRAELVAENLLTH